MCQAAVPSSMTLKFKFLNIESKSNKFCYAKCKLDKPQQQMSRTSIPTSVWPNERRGVRNLCAVLLDLDDACGRRLVARAYEKRRSA